MDFNDSPEEATFRADARKWLADVTTLRSERSRCHTQQLTLSERISKAKIFQSKKVDSGFAAITLPREYGGRGGTAMQQIIFLQEEAKFENFDTVEFFGVGLAMCIPTILHNGTEAQRKRYARPGVRGEEIWCQLFSEPAGGSDVAAARTSAVRQGDDWVMNGQKIWTSGAHFSDFGIVTTRTDASLPKHRGMTVFIVDMRSPGVEVRPIRQLSGEAEFNEVFFTDVRIPDANRLGGVNDGWNVALSMLMHERVGIGARSGDLGWRDLLLLSKRVGREQQAAIGEKIVDTWLVEFGCQLLSCRGQTALSRGQQPGPEQSILKMLKAPLLQQCAYLAMDLMGESGALTAETLGEDWSKVEKAWTFGAGIRIAGGSDEILRNIVAERVLGLPPDIRLDKNVPFNQVPA